MSQTTSTSTSSLLLALLADLTAKVGADVILEGGRLIIDIEPAELAAELLQREIDDDDKSVAQTKTKATTKAPVKRAKEPASKPVKKTKPKALLTYDEVKKLLVMRLQEAREGLSSSKHTAEWLRVPLGATPDERRKVWDKHRPQLLDEKVIVVERGKGPGMIYELGKGKGKGSAPKASKLRPPPPGKELKGDLSKIFDLPFVQDDDDDQGAGEG